MENIRDNAMRLVFRYLSDADLNEMSSICRSWSNLIEEENLLKGPQFITREIIRTHKKIITLKDNVFNFTHKNPCLILFFTNKNFKSRIVKRLHTKLAPIYCYTAILKRDFIENENTLWTIIIPCSSEIELNAFSFGERFYLPGFYCLETCSFLEIDLEYYLEMKPYYEEFLIDRTNFPTRCFIPTCMILLCVYYNIPHLLRLVKTLSTWFTIGPIWGGTIDSSEACNRLWDAPPHFSKTNIIQILITGNNMLAKHLIFNENYNTEQKILKKFKNLRKNIKLMKHSIAFLCTPTARYNDFYKIESTMFKKVFPEVPLAQIFSQRPFGAKNIKEFYKYLKRIKPHVNNKFSTFLLISYN